MATVAYLEKRLDRIDEEVSSIKRNHDGLNEKLIRLDAKMDGYNKDLKHMGETIIEVRQDVKTLISEPGKKWNNVTMFVITSVIGIVIGFVLTKLFI